MEKSPLKQNFSFIPLHTRFDLLGQCCDMLNKEWPRSYAARCYALENSCDILPCSLILVERNGADRVIGHSRLSTIPGHRHAVLLESLLIAEERRGKGFGKLIMMETENHARKLGIDTIYLSTRDKQEFYRHLGYEICQPLGMYGNNVKLPLSINTESRPSEFPFFEMNNFKNNSNVPLPPPLPVVVDTNFNKPRKEWMKKHL